MLKELANIDSFGSALTLYKFCQIFKKDKPFFTWELKKYSESIITGQFHFNNIIWLLQEIKIIIIEDNFIRASYDTMGFEDFCELVNKRVIEELVKQDEIVIFFNSSIRYNFQEGYYHVLFKEIHFKYSALRDILISTNFFIRKEHVLIINKLENDSFFKEYKRERRKISLEELKERLLTQESNGRLAEEFVLKYELKRLNTHVNVNKIKIISDIDVAAGYDITSYGSLDSNIIDRFIEVKSYSVDKKFYWSRNERDKAAELKDLYCIYLVNINKIYENNYEPEMIVNPVQYFYDENNLDWIIQQDTVLITNIRGE